MSQPKPTPPPEQPPPPDPRDLEPFHVADCFQCRKCSAGCPVASVAADRLPHELIGDLQLGDPARAQRSRFLWLCVGCGACVTRCPNRVDIPAVIDLLRVRLLRAGLGPEDDRVLAFHRAFLDTVRRRGRSHELSVVRRYKSATGTWLDDLGLGLRLLRRGKIRLGAGRVRDRDALHRAFEPPETSDPEEPE